MPWISQKSTLATEAIKKVASNFKMKGISSFLEKDNHSLLGT